MKSSPRVSDLVGRPYGDVGHLYGRRRDNSKRRVLGGLVFPPNRGERSTPMVRCTVMAQLLTAVHLTEKLKNGTICIYLCMLIYIANFQCTDGLANCGGSSPSRVCVRQRRICDGRNDCGNNWDELNETCGQFA